MTALVIYLVCEPETPELAEAAVEGGADIVELGIPFSDPLAEGPTIQRASERALARGMRTAECIECIADTRARIEAPLVPMTYAAILEAYGYERFATDSRAAGATSTIVVDLPVEEHPEVTRIQLVAPTSTDERIALCAKESDGWSLPRLGDGNDRRPRGGLPRPRRPRRTRPRRNRQAAVRRLRDLDPRTRRGGRAARRRGDRRIAGRAGRRGGPGGASRLRPEPA